MIILFAVLRHLIGLSLYQSLLLVICLEGCLSTYIAAFYLYKFVRDEFDCSDCCQAATNDTVKIKTNSELDT